MTRKTAQGPPHARGVNDGIISGDVVWCTFSLRVVYLEAATEASTARPHVLPARGVSTPDPLGRLQHLPHPLWASRNLPRLARVPPQPPPPGPPATSGKIPPG